MENNETDNPVTSVASKATDQVEQKSQSTSVSDKPPDAASPRAPDASNHEDPGLIKQSATQAKDSAEAQSEGRDAPSGEAKPAGSSSTTASQSYVPPVKRFSAVNINKKFLQKNQPSSGASSGASSASSSSKQPGVIARPAPQSAHSHSRLVTAKLTATPVSSSPGPGWSRPNSVTPPAPSPANSSGPGKGPVPGIAPVGGPPQVAPGGKIIQPQVLKQKGDGPGKPAWRNVQPGAINSALQAQKEFPTAAEAAQSRLAKLSDSKTPPGLSDAQKQALSETADAFRGVHLDPNAHHWDEMEEEDNDDFLGDVIEFGDGRQYTIHVSEGGTADTKAPGDGPVSEAPVSKEERFVDDFDRSWPKSRQEAGRDDSAQHARSETSSNFSGHSPVSIRDFTQSRLLFNERSNRMEPIPGSRPGPRSHGQPGAVQIHRDRPDGPGRFHGNRMERDAPPHTAFRKPHESAWGTSHGPDQHARDLRELKAESISQFQSGHHDRKGRPEWSSYRTHDGLPPNGQPFGSRDPSASRSIVNGAPSIASSDHSSRYTPSVRDQRRGQYSPVAHPRELERHLPPHLTQPHSSGLPERTPADDASSRSSLPHGSPRVSQDRPLAESARPAQTQPDAGIPKPTSSVPPDDVEALRKAYLHERAERAKQRRQQEEEERMKAQERARQKAAELEAKMTAAKAAEETKKTRQSAEASAASAAPVSTAEGDKKPSEAEVLRVIEGAISPAAPSEKSPIGKAAEFSGSEADGRKSSFAKAPSHGEASHPVRDTQESSRQMRPPVAAKADSVDSWRAKSKPPVLPVENTKNDISQGAGTSVIPAVRAFDIEADESTEVIDFSDMGRLAEDKRPQRLASETDTPPLQRARPVASDFFKGSTSQKPDEDSWRRGNAVSNRPVGTDDSSQHKASSGSAAIRIAPLMVEDRGGQRANVQVHSKPHFPQANGFVPQPAPNQPAHTSSPSGPKFLRSPNTSYREAPLSALDDTMSRIKGALDVMHSADHGIREARESSNASTVRLPAPSASPSRPTKWLPPALRPSGIASNHRRTDTFDPTHPEPPRSPAPPNSNFAIRLPRMSRKIEPLTKRQINFQKYFGPVRWEILSFDPPVEGMTKKSLSVNDVLFRKPAGPYKLRKYRVLLPKSKMTLRQPPVKGSQRVVSDTTSSTAASKDLAKGAFGTPKSDQISWRSVSASARMEGEDIQSEPVASTLDVTSRSPPPELTAKTEQAPTVSRVASKPKSQRSLDVTDVAFYRDVRKTTDGNTNFPAVSFTVGSELESQSDASPSHKAPALAADSPKAGPSNISQQSAAEAPSISHASTSTFAAPSLSTGNAELSSSSAVSTQSSLQREVDYDKIFENDPFLQRPPVTPPPQNTPSSWSKSPARVPDPELLKAVWSQPSNNESIPAVNSLKNIADDLPAVPFTLQEVKSEGGTPPPAPSGHVAPTRMSASEVTRAFQTVPSGPSNGMTSTTLRGGQVPSNVSSPIGSQRVLKPPSIGLPPPPAMNPNAPRPPYMGYSTHMSNHTPSPPTLVYSHVMPNGMPGSPAATPYGQPVWMQVVQQQPQMLRAQSSSPYSPSMMSYSIPAAQNGMYPAPSTMSNPQGSPATYPSAPPPSQIMVSPVMAHATAAPTNAMYPASPMVMHMPPPGTAPQPRPYPPGPVGMGRGSMPVQNPMDPRSHPVPGPPAAPASRFPVHNQGYTPIPPQSFIRPW